MKLWGLQMFLLNDRVDVAIAGAAAVGFSR